MFRFHHQVSTHYLCHFLSDRYCQASLSGLISLLCFKKIIISLIFDLIWRELLLICGKLRWDVCLGGSCLVRLYAKRGREARKHEVTGLMGVAVTGITRELVNMQRQAENEGATKRVHREAETAMSLCGILYFTHMDT